MGDNVAVSFPSPATGPVAPAPASSLESHLKLHNRHNHHNRAGHQSNDRTYNKVLNRYDNTLIGIDAREKCLNLVKTEGLLTLGAHARGLL